MSKKRMVHHLSIMSRLFSVSFSIVSIHCVNHIIKKKTNSKPKGDSEDTDGNLSDMPELFHNTTNAQTCTRTLS